jgi:hypothetical protein
MVVQMMIPLLLLGIFKLIPESPNWLLLHDRREDAKASLMYIRGGAATEDEVEDELKLIEIAVAEELEFHRVSTYWDCFKGTNGRRTIIASGVQILEQLSGNAFMSSYAVIFLKQVGITDPIVSSLSRTCMSIAGATMGFWLPDYFGRRPILIFSAFIMWAGLWITSGISAWWPGGVSGGPVAQGLLALQMIWSMMSTGGWGCCVWIITAESGTAQLREKTVSIATTFSFICVLLVSYINPFVQNEPGNLGGKVGFIYGSFSLISIPFVYFFVPELKGRSLEELDELFNNHVPARKFSSYVAHGVGARITEVQNINADTHLHLNKGLEGIVREESITDVVENPTTKATIAKA